MVRISAVFIAACMALIAASLGVVGYLRFGLSLTEASLVALAALTVLAVYNTLAGRKRDRAEVGDQVVSLARGTGDLARQIAEFGRRLGAVEAEIETVVERASAAAQPLSAEIEELSRLVKQLADSVAVHESMLGRERSRPLLPATATALPIVEALPPTPTIEPVVVRPPPPSPAPVAVPSGTAKERIAAAFGGLDRDGIIANVRAAIEAHRIDLYLQPIVTLPQRKVRFYETLSRLKVGDGEIVAAADFLPFAEAGGLMPQLDSLSVLRCVQVVRRLSLKNRDIGLFCNLSGATLADAGFPQLLEFADANRAIAPSLVFEFAQSTVRAMGPVEHESLAALAERGFTFSMDNLSDLRVDPRELTGRGFRFIKAPATLLLNRVGAGSSDIHAADFSDLLGRFGIDLIAERIESESTVVDLLDYDVRFGQGFLFSPPRAVRAEALQGVPEETVKPEPAENEQARGGFARLLRTASGRS